MYICVAVAWHIHSNLLRNPIIRTESDLRCTHPALLDTQKCMQLKLLLPINSSFQFRMHVSENALSAHKVPPSVAATGLLSSTLTACTVLCLLHQKFKFKNKIQNLQKIQMLPSPFKKSWNALARILQAWKDCYFEAGNFWKKWHLCGEKKRRRRRRRRKESS